MTLPLHPGLGAEAAAELAVRLKRIRLAEALKGAFLPLCCAVLCCAVLCCACLLACQVHVAELWGVVPHHRHHLLSCDAALEAPLCSRLPGFLFPLSTGTSVEENVIAPL